MIPVNQLNRAKNETVKEKVFQFLKKNNHNSYKPMEIIKKVKGNDNTIRSGLRKLVEEGRIKKKDIAPNYPYFFYCTEKVGR